MQLFQEQENQFLRGVGYTPAKGILLWDQHNLRYAHADFLGEEDPREEGLY
jgi:hypothetical protein